MVQASIRKYSDSWLGNDSAYALVPLPASPQRETSSVNCYLFLSFSVSPTVVERQAYSPYS